MRIPELCEARQETILSYRRIGGEQQEDVEVLRAMKDYFHLRIASFLQRNRTCLHDYGSRIEDFKHGFLDDQERGYSQVNGAFDCRFSLGHLFDRSFELVLCSHT